MNANRLQGADSACSKRSSGGFLLGCFFDAAGISGQHQSAPQDEGGDGGRALHG
ncbi:hypothetical protein ACFOLD_11580 [Kocuria carniphila]|uniref:hypothetical protein n=1 Tax=Kocuria carniphila TaxID=262208 RepID=UPI00361BB488